MAEVLAEPFAVFHADLLSANAARFMHGVDIFVDAVLLPNPVSLAELSNISSITRTYAGLFSHRSGAGL